MAVSQWDLRHRALPTCSLKIKGFAGGPRTSCATYFSAASAPAGPNLPNAMSTTHIQSASIATQASVYFDGKCVSHSITMADGTKKSVGVVLAAELTFGTAAPEVMECVAGSCEYLLQGATAWASCHPGQRFSVPGQSSFQIRVADSFHYICHYG